MLLSACAEWMLCLILSCTVLSLLLLLHVLGGRYLSYFTAACTFAGRVFCPMQHCSVLSAKAGGVPSS